MKHRIAAVLLLAGILPVTAQTYTGQAFPGTAAAVNAPATVGNNTDTTFRLVSPTSWVQ